MGRNEEAHLDESVGGGGGGAGVTSRVGKTSDDIWGDSVIISEICGAMGSYGEIWGDAVRYGEIW